MIIKLRPEGREGGFQVRVEGRKFHTKEQQPRRLEAGRLLIDSEK